MHTHVVPSYYYRIPSYLHNLFISAADLIGVPRTSLVQSLCNKEITIGKKSTAVPLKPHEATSAAASLAKELYGKLFDCLVDKVRKII